MVKKALDAIDNKADNVRLSFYFILFLLMVSLLLCCLWLSDQGNEAKEVKLKDFLSYKSAGDNPADAERDLVHLFFSQVIFLLTCFTFT